MREPRWAKASEMVPTPANHSMTAEWSVASPHDEEEGGSEESSGWDGDEAEDAGLFDNKSKGQRNGGRMMVLMPSSSGALGYV